MQQAPQTQAIQQSAQPQVRTNTSAQEHELARLAQLAYMAQFSPPSANVSAKLDNTNPAAAPKATQDQLQSMLQMQEHLKQQIDALSKLRSQMGRS